MDSAFISKHAQEVFDACLRPAGLGPEFNVWQLVGFREVVHLTLRQEGASYYSDTYRAWIGAKILAVNPRSEEAREKNRRFALGIQWTGDEMENLEVGVGDKCHCLIHERIERAVACFTDFAEEFEEGGAMPTPKIGRTFPPVREKSAVA